MTVVPTPPTDGDSTSNQGTNASQGDTITTAGNAAATASVTANPGVTASPAAVSDGMSPILRRNRPGTKAAEYSSWPEEDWTEMDSTLAVQQVCLICHHYREY